MPQAVSDKLEANLIKYTDLTFINSANIDDILSIQKNAEGEAFDEENAYELGKLKNADYEIFLTIRKSGNDYSLSARYTNLTTRENKATVVSKPRSSEQALYSQSGSAVDEITIELCKALGKELSETEKSYLMNGEVGLTDTEKQSIYSSDINTYNERIAALNKEIDTLSLSSDIDSGIEEEN